MTFRIAMYAIQVALLQAIVLTATTKFWSGISDVQIVRHVNMCKLLPLTERLRNNQKFPTLNTSNAIRDCLEAATKIESLEQRLAVAEALLREACEMEQSAHRNEDVSQDAVDDWVKRANAAVKGGGE